MLFCDGAAQVGEGHERGTRRPRGPHQADALDGEVHRAPLTPPFPHHGPEAAPLGRPDEISTGHFSVQGLPDRLADCKGLGAALHAQDERRVPIHQRLHHTPRRARQPDTEAGFRVRKIPVGELRTLGPPRVERQLRLSNQRQRLRQLCRAPVRDKPLLLPLAARNAPWCPYVRAGGLRRHALARGARIRGYPSHHPRACLLFFHGPLLGRGSSLLGLGGEAGVDAGATSTRPCASPAARVTCTLVLR